MSNNTDKTPNSDKVISEINEAQDAHVEEVVKKIDRASQRHKDVRTVLMFKQARAGVTTLASEKEFAVAAG